MFAGTLPADTYRGEQLEMGQYPNFFATSQVVGQRGVSIYKSRIMSRVNVIAEGRFYILELGDRGDDLSVASLAAALSQIAQHARSAATQSAYLSPGVLTYGAHITQYRAFRQMQRDAVNHQSLDELKHTLFTVSLDTREAPATLAEAAILAHSRHPENRWAHASLQLVIFGNAKAAAICNFTAYLDGNVMMRGASEIHRRAGLAALRGCGPRIRISHFALWIGMSRSLSFKMPREISRQ